MNTIFKADPQSRAGHVAEARMLWKQGWRPTTSALLHPQLYKDGEDPQLVGADISMKTYYVMRGIEMAIGTLGLLS